MFGIPHQLDRIEPELSESSAFLPMITRPMLLATSAQLTFHPSSLSEDYFCETNYVIC